MTPTASKLSQTVETADDSKAKVGEKKSIAYINFNKAAACPGV